MIHLNCGTTYRLTYQPAPINAWSLHSPDRNASDLLGLIDRALTHPSTASRSSVRTYHQQLHPWCIVRLLPQLQRLVVARFRRRTSIPKLLIPQHTDTEMLNLERCWDDTIHLHPAIFADTVY